MTPYFQRDVDAGDINSAILLTRTNAYTTPIDIPFRDATTSVSTFVVATAARYAATGKMAQHKMGLAS